MHIIKQELGHLHPTVQPGKKKSKTKTIKKKGHPTKKGKKRKTRKKKNHSFPRL